jgi:ribosomal protein S4
MTIRKPFVWRGLVDLSWNRYNLYNLYKYSRQGPEREINKTAFQLRWRAKQLCSAYHAGHLTQHQFRKQRQSTLPRIQRQPQQSDTFDSGASNQATMSLLPYPPTSMLAFAFLERRVDMALFRACFTTSIWESRSLCNTGDVWVNGQRIRTPGYLLEDGDIIQVNPERLRLLNPVAKRPQLALETPSSSSAAAAEDETEPAEETEIAEGAGEQIIKRPAGKRLPVLASRDLGFHGVPFMAPWLFVPDYLEVNYRNLTICFLRSPTIKPGRCEVPSPYDELQHQRAYDYFTSQSRPLGSRKPRQSVATERMVMAQ